MKMITIVVIKSYNAYYNSHLSNKVHILSIKMSNKFISCRNNVAIPQFCRISCRDKLFSCRDNPFSCRDAKITSLLLDSRVAILH